MSKEQLSAQTQTEAAEESRTQDDIHGLPPHLFGQVMKLRPGDADALTRLLRIHPEYTDKILAAASPQVGLSTIKQAQAMVQTNAVGGSGSLGATRPGTEYLDETATPVVPQVRRVETPAEHAEELRDLEGSASSGEAKKEPESDQAKPAKDEAWVAGARAYNAAHAHLVSKLVEILQDRSFLGADGQIDVQKVKAFQATQGIDADGKVGPATIAAAQKYQDAHPNNFGME
jgi:hypothetical protein